MESAVSGALDAAAHCRVANLRVTEDEVRSDRSGIAVIRGIGVPAAARVSRFLALAPCIADLEPRLRRSEVGHILRLPQRARLSLSQADELTFVKVDLVREEAEELLVPRRRRSRRPWASDRRIRPAWRAAFGTRSARSAAQSSGRNVPPWGQRESKLVEKWMPKWMPKIFDGRRPEGNARVLE